MFWDSNPPMERLYQQMLKRSSQGLQEHPAQNTSGICQYRVNIIPPAAAEGDEICCLRHLALWGRSKFNLNQFVVPLARLEK